MSTVRFPGEYIKRISIHAIANADAVMRPLGLTAAQSDLLLYLDHRGEEETTVQDIGTFFQLKHPTVIGLLKRLEEKGFVTTTVSTRDRRCRVVHLTDKIDAVRRTVAVMRDDLDQRSARGFSDEELAQLTSFLQRVCQNVSDS